MSKFPKFSLVLALAFLGTPALSDTLGLGRVALPEEIAAWDKDIRPDGSGLPKGSGDAIVGEEVFAEQCASCHGDFAEGIDNWPKLAGGFDTLDREDPLKTVGSYWPYLSTTWDYVNRSMPYGNAQSLTADEVYAVVAYILYSNDMIEDDFVLSDETFTDVEMTNADGFFVDNRAEVEYASFSADPCMSDCKDAVEVTMRALVLDVTPEEDKAEAATPVAVVEEVVEEIVEETVVEEVVEEAALDAELVAAGEKVFKKCKACHQVGEGAKNRSGPMLNGVVGATAAQVEGFKYSKAIMAAAEDGLVWDAASLAEFLTKPKAYLKGTKMSFNGLKKEDERTAVIEYLKSFGG